MSKYFDILAYLMGKAAGGGGGGGGDVTVESKSISSNGTFTAPPGKAYSPVTVDVPNSYAAGDEGKVVSDGALVAQGSDSVTQNGTVDTTLINSLTVNVAASGLNYVKETKTPSSNVISVDRHFTDFILIAEVKTAPSTVPNKNNALWMQFVYLDEQYPYKTGVMQAICQSGAQATTAAFEFSAFKPSLLSVGATSINLTPKATKYMVGGEWLVTQIELPSGFGYYPLGPVEDALNAQGE